MPKRITAITLIVLIIVLCLLSSSIDVASGTIEVKAEEEQLVELYSLDGRIESFKISEVEAQCAVGWYETPVVQLWNIDGSSSIIRQDEMQSYLDTGRWFTELPQVNEEDMILLARVIHAEATENSSLRLQDRQYVGAVVMNRLRTGHWGNTLRSVIYAPGQYACVGNKKFNSYPPQECLDIAKQLLLGETYGVPSNVIFQAQFTQGTGIWKQVGVHYYCFGNLN